jgi:hypothetical protein
LKHATHQQVLDALTTVAAGNTPTAAGLAGAVDLGLVENGALTPSGRRLVEAGLLKRRPLVTRDLFAQAMRQLPESRVLLEGEWGHELSRGQAEQILRYAHQPCREWPSQAFTRLWDALNFGGLISYSRKAGTIRVTGGSPSASPPESSAQIAPATPYRNKRLLAGIVAGTRERLYWFDAHFTRLGLQFIYDEADFDQLKSLRVLSCGRSELTAATLDDYRRLQGELRPRDVIMEWRTLLDREDFTDKHDRWLLADKVLWNVPPYSAVVPIRFTPVSARCSVLGCLLGGPVSPRP